MPKPKSNLTLVIVTRFASELLKQTLDSYDKNSVLDNELIIVADFPNWQTMKIIQEKKLTFYTVYFSHYMICCNFGAWKANREYVAFINDDVYFGPEWDKALMDIMKPNVMGSVCRYERPRNYPCGYVGKDWRTFKPELLYQAIEENKHQKLEQDVGFPTTHHRETFFKYYGYTFHCNQGQGHERHNWYRLHKEDPEAKMLKSYKSGIFHYGGMGNIDKSPQPVPFDSSRDLGYAIGLKICLGCGKKEAIPKGEEESKWIHSEDSEDVFKRGYWLCSDCKSKGIKDVGKFKLWNYWPKESIANA